MSDLRTALEEALAANPDDVASHAAYADHLADLGDPRGELIQVQLALEDPSCKGDRRRDRQTGKAPSQERDRRGSQHDCDHRH